MPKKKKIAKTMSEAVEFNDLDVLRTLIRQGHDVNALDPEGETPLHIAASNDNKEAIMTLLDAGAQVNKLDSFGVSPLHLALENDCPEAVIVLEFKGGREIS
jgi:ankyrin repeat protein